MKRTNAVAVVGAVTVAGLFLPVALQGATEKQNQLRCANFLRQLGLGAMQYADVKRFYPHVNGLRELDGDAGTFGVCQGICDPWATGTGCAPTESCGPDWEDNTIGYCGAAGTVGVGQSCNAGGQCAPGLICAGTCVVVCDPFASMDLEGNPAIDVPPGRYPVLVTLAAVIDDAGARAKVANRPVLAVVVVISAAVDGVFEKLASAREEQGKCVAFR